MVFHKAYVDSARLAALAARGISRVTRAKDNLLYRARRNVGRGKPGILKDQLVVLAGRHKGMEVRRVEAAVEIEGEPRVMAFLTKNTQRSPRTVCDLYRRRRDIEVFFKQVKQCLKLSGFLGHSFARLLAVTRSAPWDRFDLAALLKSYGTASACCDYGHVRKPQSGLTLIRRPSPYPARATDQHCPNSRSPWDGSEPDC